jgi:predicted dehydrogenase
MPNIAILSTAHIHTKAFIENILAGTDGRRVAAIWDDNAERGAKYAALANAPFVEALDQVLADPAVDGFIICAENTRHLPLLRKTIPVGKPVFCEKPLVTNSEELAAVRALLGGAGAAPLFCGYFQPFTGEMQAIAKLLKEKALGEITRVSYVNAHHAVYARWFDHPDLAWFCNPEASGGGAFMDMGTHAVHLLRTFFGPVKQVWAEIGNHSGVYPRVDDYGVAQLRFASGISGRVEAAWTQTGGIGGLTVVGSKATIWNTPEGYVIGEPGSAPQKINPTDGVADRVDRLVSIIRGEIGHDKLQADLESIIDSVTIMEAAYRSAACGGWVEPG